MLTASLAYDANSAWLNVQQVNVTAVSGVAYTTASYGAATRVQSAFQQINAQLANAAANGTSSATASAAGMKPVSTDFMIGAASLQQSPTSAVAQRSLESLSGQIYGASAAMTLSSV